VERECNSLGTSKCSVYFWEKGRVWEKKGGGDQFGVVNEFLGEKKVSSQKSFNPEAFIRSLSSKFSRGENKPLKENEKEGGTRNGLKKELEMSSEEPHNSGRIKRKYRKATWERERTRENLRLKGKGTERVHRGTYNLGTLGRHDTRLKDYNGGTKRPFLIIKWGGGGGGSRRNSA